MASSHMVEIIIHGLLAIYRLLVPHPINIPLGHLINFNQFLKQILFPLLFVVPRVDLVVTQIFNLFFAHQVVFHPAFQVRDLEFLASFRHQLVFVQARVVPNRVLFAFVEMVQREASLVWLGGNLSCAT